MKKIFDMGSSNTFNRWDWWQTSWERPAINPDEYMFTRRMRAPEPSLVELCERMLAKDSVFYRAVEKHQTEFKIPIHIIEVPVVYKDYTCVNMKCGLAGQVVALEEEIIPQYCRCGDELQLVPTVEPVGITITVREANALRHALMNEFLPHEKYAIVLEMVHDIDRKLTNMGYPYRVDVVDTEGS